jgi:hypothetical protein
MRLPGHYYFVMGIVWVILLTPSFLFPEWTYYQIAKIEGKTKILKYGSPRIFRFSDPPLHVDRTVPGWHGLEQPMSFDAVEHNNGRLLLEWGLISIVYLALVRQALRIL